MKTNSIYNIPDIIASEKDILPFIEKRIGEETFERVKSPGLAREESKRRFKEILHTVPLHPNYRHIVAKVMFAQEGGRHARSATI